MIVMALGAAGVLSALWSPERIRRLAHLPLRRVWLVWLALATQVVVLEAIGPFLPKTVGEVVHLGTYAVLVLFIVVNRHLPGALVIAAGTACNLIAITANGGTMPASASAWQRAGLDRVAPGEFANSTAVRDPNLLALGDVFAVPAHWPLANVFSIGDVLIVLGGTILAHRWCSRPLTPDVAAERDDADSHGVAVA